MLTDDDVINAYQEWLKGSSLRALGHRFGIPHGSLHNIFRKKYGMQACSLKSKSFVRSLVSDYESNPSVIQWALTQHMMSDEHYYKSKHSLQQLSNYQTLREEYLLDTVEAAPWVDPEDTTLDFLRLEMFEVVLKAILKTLEACIYNPGVTYAA